jgi:hypothetical protein
LTFSSAFFQSSPNPICREARFISTSHQANSFSASAISSSGVRDELVLEIENEPLRLARRRVGPDRSCAAGCRERHAPRGKLLLGGLPDGGSRPGHCG